MAAFRRPVVGPQIPPTRIAVDSRAGQRRRLPHQIRRSRRSGPNAGRGQQADTHQQASDVSIVDFASAVALNSLAQIRIAQIQGRGAAHGALLIMGAGALAAVALFYVAARYYWAPGLLWAWLGKAIVELALTYAPLPRRARAWASPDGADM